MNNKFDHVKPNFRKLDNRDLRDVIDLHMIAFKDHLNILIGRKYIRDFFKWFIKNPGSINIVCVNNQNSIQGYIISAPWGYQRKMNTDLLKIAVEEILKRPWILINMNVVIALKQRLLTILGLNDTIKIVTNNLEGNILSLVGIAVSESAKGKGIAKKMIQEFETIAIEKGFTHIRLSVYRENVIAIKFYENGGWELSGGIRDDAKVLSYIKKVI